MTEQELKDLAGGVRYVGDYTREDTLLFGKAFEDTQGSPLALMYRRLLEDKVKGYYWELAHLGASGTQAQMVLMCGKIQALEEILRLPDEFIVAAKTIIDTGEGVRVGTDL